MTIYKTLGIKKRDVEKFTRLQKKIFFTKADIPVSNVKLKKSLLNLQIDKDKAYVKTIFQAQFGASPFAIIPLPRATLHRVYKVSLKKKSYILRINAWGSVFRGFNFLTEKRIMENLSKKKLPFLVVYKADVSRKQVPFDYEVIDVAKGKDLFDISRKKKIPSSVHFELGRIMRRVHKIKTEEFGPFDIYGSGIYPSWKKYIYCNFDKHIRQCLKIGTIDKKQFTIIRNLFIKNDGVFDKVTPTLLHGDLSNHNVFTDGKKITALIDWEDSVSGDPIFDIAYFGSGCYLHNEWLEAFLRGYQSIHSLNRDFWLRYWLYFLRISLAKTIARFRLSTHMDPSLPPVKKRLLYGIQGIQSLV